MVDANAIAETLRARFGHDTFRPGQAEIVDAILAGGPVLAVMPTGSGKSLCYQLPALVLRGLAVVVSPLIALMRDQVDQLTRLGVRAAALTSAESDESRRQVWRELKAGELDLLYVAPERFRSPRIVEELAGRVALFAVDEAHCISAWGHDFRPDYARLGDVIHALAPERVVALTATATADVRADIVRQLGLDGVTEIVTGFDRPNLALAVEDARGQAKKLETTLAILDEALAVGGSAIVYAATRRRTEEVADELRAVGHRAAAYHAGLGAEVRTDVQQRFASGALRVIVATTAFGMGVDKRDVRAVVHWDIPGSTEAYYQEVGRAGRDGEPARGVLLWDPSDLRYAHLRVEGSCPTAQAVAAARAGLERRAYGGRTIDASLEDLVEALEADVGPATRAAIVELGRLGWISLGPGSIELHDDGGPIDGEQLERRLRHERRKLQLMVGYVERAACRRRYLTDYFGDPNAPERCGTCDRCTRPAVRALEGAARTDALKALSCVARMQGRYGKGRVIDVLLGSRAKPVVESGLDALSTHGLLSTWTKDEVGALLDSFSRAGLVAITIDEYPKLRLTADGARALKSEIPLAIDHRTPRWGDPGVRVVVTRRGEGKATSEPPSPARDAANALVGVDRALFEALRNWRQDEARRQSKPAYVIAHDALLASIAVVRPRTRDELGQLLGIGPAKLDRYGDALLALVATADAAGEGDASLRPAVAVAHAERGRGGAA